MGNVVDRMVIRRGFKASKFRFLINLAVTRTDVLMKQRQFRRCLATSDVLQLLNDGHRDFALLRVEQVIKERNMLDVLAMIKGYCVLLGDRVALIQQHQACPDELKEAVSSLIFAASRCGEFPELLKIRSLFASYYGKHFVSRVDDLHNSCAVNPTIIQKLSTKLPSSENRMKVLQQIADENGISLQLQEALSTPQEESDRRGKEVEESEHPSRVDGVEMGGCHHSNAFHQELDRIPECNDHRILNLNGRKWYKDAAEAAQDAFLAAAYAAHAAKAAMELSRAPPDGPKLIQTNNGEEPNSLGLFDRLPYPVDDKYTVLQQDSDSDDDDDDKPCLKVVGPRRNYSVSSSSGKSDDDDDESVMIEKQCPWRRNQGSECSRGSSSKNQMPRSYGGLKWKRPHSVRTRR